LRCVGTTSSLTISLARFTLSRSRYLARNLLVSASRLDRSQAPPSPWLLPSLQPAWEPVAGVRAACASGFRGRGSTRPRPFESSSFNRLCEMRSLLHRAFPLLHPAPQRSLAAPPAAARWRVASSSTRVFHERTSVSLCEATAGISCLRSLPQRKAKRSAKKWRAKKEQARDEAGEDSSGGRQWWLVARRVWRQHAELGETSASFDSRKKANAHLFTETPTFVFSSALTDIGVTRSVSSVESSAPRLCFRRVIAAFKASSAARTSPLAFSSSATIFSNLRWRWPTSSESIPPLREGDLQRVKVQLRLL